MIDAIYTAHTCRLSKWDIDDIIDGTLFKLSGHTNRIPKNGDFQMLDWDFRSIKRVGIDQLWKRHLRIVKNHKIETVMSPDLWRDNWRFAITKYRTLCRYSDRVIMPVHVKPKRSDIEVAWPMGVWTEDHVAVWDVSDQVTHLLGGSPHAQIDMSGYFPNLRSIDGNQVYWTALKFGKFWRGRWVRPEPRLSNEDCFRESVRNITHAWESL